MASLRFRFLAAFFAFAALGLLALRFRSTPLATTASLVDPASRSTPGADAGTTLPPASLAASPTATPPAPEGTASPLVAAPLPARDPEEIRAQATAHAAAFEAWLARSREIGAADRPADVLLGLELAAARRSSLRELIAVDPRLALELAVPFAQRAGLPAPIEALLERRLDARGTLDVSISCLGLVTRLERSVWVEGERFDAFVFGRREPQHTKIGLPLHGIAIDGALALAESPYRLLDTAEKAARGLALDRLAIAVGPDVTSVADPLALDKLTQALVGAESQVGPHLATLNSGGPTPALSPPETAATTPWILGAKRVLWVQVDFNDDPGAVATVEQIGVTNTQVSAFYAANSQGKTTMAFTVLPATLRLPRDKSVYNASSSSVGTLQTDAAVLARAYDTANGGDGTYNPDRYDRWIVVFKRMPVYTFGGQAQLTGPQVRMNGNISPGTVAHELGHTQGLSHSHYWLPSGNSAIGAGTHVEYGDVFDAMGSSASSTNNHFNAPQKAKLGYLVAADITTITDAGTYRLARHDHSDAAGLRALKIAPAGLGYEYWLEHRQFGPTAFNSAQLDRLRRGVLLHWGQGKAPSSATGPGSYLIDATPGSAGNANDAPIRIGDTFVDPDAGVTIRPLAVGGTGPGEYIDVQVAFGAFEGNRNPVLTAEPPAGLLYARTNIIFNATATDPDNDPLYFRWDFGDNTLNPNLNNITRRFTKGGTFDLRVSAHDGRGGIATKTLPLTVVDPLVAWTQQTSGATQSLYAAIYAGGRFVVAGDNGAVTTSPDGVTWTRGTGIPNTHFPRAIAHSGTRYAVVGLAVAGATVRATGAYSDDGNTWTVATFPAGVGSLNALAYGAGRFVAVGETGRIYQSTDGATWTEGTSPVTNPLRAVAYADGLFVATGDAGRILTSADGQTWTLRTPSPSTTSTLVALTRHNGAWFASASTSECCSSPDGTTWTRFAATGRTNGTSRLASVGGVLLTTTTNGGIAIAEEPRTWAQHQVVATAGVTFYGLAEAAGKIVIVGSGGRIFTADSPPASTGPISTPIAPPTLRNDADALKVSVGRPNVLAATGIGFTKLELYANGTKVSELIGTAGPLRWTPAALGTYSLVVRGTDASGASVVSAAVPAVAGFAQWNWRNPLPHGVDLRGAVRVGSKWWIVGSTGTFFTLDDRGTPASVAFPTTQHLTGIAYGDGRFVVSGPYFDAGFREEIGSLWTSTDGYQWTPLLTTVFDNFNLNFVAYTPGKWVTASTGGLILSSTDGVNWTRRLSGLTTSLRSGVFGATTWVVVGNSGRILTSPDGTTWTARTSGVTTDLAAVAFDRGRFVAVGTGGVILSSPDGITWTRPTSGTTTTLNAIASVKGSWVTAGDNSVTLVSSDAVIWAPATLENKTVGSLFVGGSGDAGLLLGRMGEIFTADSASIWRRVTQGTGESRLGLVYAGGRFVAVGQITDPVTRTTGVPIWSSTNGLTWTRANAHANFANLNEVGYGQGMYIAVGESRVFTSTDALTWTQRTFGFTATLTGIAASPTALVAGSLGGNAYTSDDGTTWSQRTTGATTSLRSAAFGAGRFVLVGDGGRIIHSTDGVTWTAATSGTTSALQTIGYFEDLGFLAAGDSGAMLTSTDGITWLALESGIADSITALARTPLGYVAGGGANGTLLTSLDGTGWTVAALPANRALRGIAASPTAIVAVGDLGTMLTFELVDTTPPPAITAQPAPGTVAAGATVTFAVEASHATHAVFQWFKDGAPIPGANTPAYTVTAVTPARTGSYTVAITSPTGTATSSAAVLALGVAADPGRLVNLSILTSLASAADSFTFGVVIGGADTVGTKPLLVRAAGPSLGALGVGGTLEDPKLEFFTGSTKVGENDDWGGVASTSAVMASVGAFAFSAPNSKDAAISFLSLASGANSAKISGTGAGMVIAELYDATPAAVFTATTPRLINVSVLKHLGTGVTAGFVIGGSTARTVLIRAIGPTLGGFGVADTVADPQLALFSGQTERARNDNWGGGTALAAAFAQVGAFGLAADSRDAALLATLAPGNYTVQVSGVAGTTGVALVEVYEVP